MAVMCRNLFLLSKWKSNENPGPKFLTEEGTEMFWDDPANLLTWKRLAEVISQMPEADQNKPVIAQNSNTGAYFGFQSVAATCDEFGEPGPQMPSHPILQENNQWLWQLPTGEYRQSRHQPERFDE